MKLKTLARIDTINALAGISILCTIFALLGTFVVESETIQAVFVVGSSAVLCAAMIAFAITKGAELLRGPAAEE